MSLVASLETAQTAGTVETSKDLESYSTSEKESSMWEDLDLEKWRRLIEENVNIFAQAKERAVFVASVVNFGLICAAVNGHGGFLPWYYSFKFIFLIFTRLIVYSSKSWQWFLLDFCYFGNAALLIFLWIWPNQYLFSLVFSIANGPILLGIVLFGNSLVFHSVDKTTSLLIHITPPIITYILKFQQNDLKSWDVRNWKENVCGNDSVRDPSSCGNFFYMVFVPFVFVLCHQCGYYLIVQVLCKKRIKNDPNSLTTYTYLFRKSQRQGLLWKSIGVCGPRARIYVFGLVFIAFSLGTSLFAMVLFRYEWLHFSFILMNGFVAILNGSTFYGKVFAKKQSRRREKLQKRMDRMGSK